MDGRQFAVNERLRVNYGGYHYPELNGRVVRFPNRQIAGYATECGRTRNGYAARAVLPFDGNISDSRIFPLFFIFYRGEKTETDHRERLPGGSRRSKCQSSPSVSPPPNTFLQCRHCTFVNDSRGRQRSKTTKTIEIDFSTNIHKQIGTIL